MKILVRDAETHLWNKGKGAWTSDLAEAAQFPSINSAAREALKHNEQDLEVVLRYERESRLLALNPVYCLSHPVNRDAGPSISLLG